MKKILYFYWNNNTVVPGTVIYGSKKTTFIVFNIDPLQETEEIINKVKGFRGNFLNWSSKEEEFLSLKQEDQSIILNILEQNKKSFVIYRDYFSLHLIPSIRPLY
jgi:hypothetical protein